MAGTLAATLMATAHAVLRTVGETSDQLGREGDVLHHADQALRFMTRRCRGAAGVATINSVPVNSDFELDVGGGDTVRFSRWITDEKLQFRDTRVDGNTYTAADHVTGLTAVFYEADATTVTTDPAAARLIELTLTVDLPRDHQPERTVSGRVWVRPW